MNRKTFLLDTNVLLYDPKVFKNFKNALLIIPISVIEELDDMKRLPNDLGRNARLVMRSFDEIRERAQNDFMKGLPVGENTEIRVFSKQKQEINGQFILDQSSRKNQVLYSAYLAAKEYPNLIFLSKDLASRLKAQMTGIQAEDYKNTSFSQHDIYTGLRTAEISKREIDLFMKDGVLDWDDQDILANEYCVLTSQKEGTHIIGRYDKDLKQLVALNALPQDLWSIKPRNIQQRCALDLLLREDIKLVTLVGQAGTGKTLLALACALRKVFDEGFYSKILVSRPIMPLGKDIGFLPGTKEEKLFHWMQPIYDNLEYLCQAGSGSDETHENLRWIKESQKLELEAVTYIRGRTLPNMFMIIDEAQNLTPHEIKTVISRAGEGTKVILAGDPSQIDNPYLDADTNGLTFAISKFGDQRIFGNMKFDVTERSELASLAAEVL